MAIPSISEDQIAEVLNKHLTPSEHITTPDRLFGRDDKLKQIERAFNSSGRHIFIYGDRGVGKSSVALTAAKIHQNNDYDPIHVTCSESSTFGGILQAIGNASIDVEQRLETPGTQSSFNATIMGTGAGYAPGAPSQPKLEKPTDLNGAIDIIRYIEKKYDDKIVIIIDEFERISDVHHKNLFSEFIKNIPDTRGKIKFILCGIGASVDELIGEHPSAGRRLETVELRRLHHDHLWKIITTVSDSFGVKIDREFLIRVSVISDGFPHYVHLIGESLFWSMHDDSEEIRTCNAKHFMAGVKGALERTEAILRSTYDKATQKTKNTQDYELSLWSLADHHTLRRQVTEIYEKSYLRIVDELKIPKEKWLKKDTFNIRMLRLRDDSHQRILIGHGSGWFSFRENVLRGYVRLKAENRGIQLNPDHHIRIEN